MRKIKTGTILFIFIFFLIAVTMPISTVYAEKPYEKTSELVCGTIRIQMITKCIDDSNPVVPDCTEQKIVFKNLTTGKTLSIPARGQLVVVKDANGHPISKSLDALATSWLCVKGKNQSYLIVWYNTGGNCDECEWQEILDLTGKKLASTVSKTEKNLKTYDRIWAELGLPNIEIKDFIEIPLHK